MTTAIVTALTGLVVTIITNILTFFLTRRKYNTEVDSQQIQNMGASFDVYKKMMEESLSSQERTLKSTIEAQDKKLDMLQGENDSLKLQVSQLQMQMLNLLGNICLDSTCRLRKMNFTSDLKFSDSGASLED